MDFSDSQIVFLELFSVYISHLISSRRQLEQDLIVKPIRKTQASSADRPEFSYRWAFPILSDEYIGIQNREEINMSIFGKLFPPKKLVQSHIVYKARWDVSTFTVEKIKKLARNLDAQFRNEYGNLLLPLKTSIGVSEDGGIYLLYSLKPADPEVIKDAYDALCRLWYPYTIE